MERRERLLELGDKAVANYDALIAKGETEDKAAAKVVTDEAIALTKDTIKFKHQAAVNTKKDEEDLAKLIKYKNEL